MSASTTRVRVSKSCKRAPVKAAGTKRKTLRAPRKYGKRASAGVASGDALLVARFAEALGAVPRRGRAAKRRSLAQALDLTVAPAGPGSIIDVMPGARLGAIRPSHDGAGDAAWPEAPCLGLHRRNRTRRRLVGAGSWCAALAVTAAIVGTAAAGLLAHAPHARQTIATASAAQF